MPPASATRAAVTPAEPSVPLSALLAALRREDFDEALRLSIAGLESNSSDIDLQRARVVSHVRLGQLHEALSFIEGVFHSMGEEKYALQLEHAYVLYRLGKVEDALTRVRSEDISSNVYSRILEAQVLYRLGRPKEAAEAYIGALKSRTSKYSSTAITEIRANVIAAMAAASGDVLTPDNGVPESDEADEFMRSEKCSARDSFEIGFNYASYLLSRGKVESAQQFLEVAIRIGRDALELDDADEDEIEEELEPATIQLAYSKSFIMAILLNDAFQPPGGTISNLDDLRDRTEEDKHTIEKTRCLRATNRLSLLGLEKEATEVYIEALKNKPGDSVLYATTLNNLIAARSHSDVLDSLKRFDKLLPKGVAAVSATTIFNPSLEEKLPDKLKAILSINRAILLVLCNKVNAARNLCVAIRESRLGAIGDTWQLSILTEASALIKAGKHRQAEELLEAESNRSEAIILMQAQVALSAKDLKKACTLLEEILHGDGSMSKDQRKQEMIVGTLADLFEKTANPERAIEVLEGFCGRDAEISTESRQGALRLLAGLRRKHGLWSGANSCLQAMLESPHVQDSEKARLLVLSDLAEYYLHIEPEASEQLLSSLPPLPELDNIDVDDLESNAGGFVTGRARADTKDTTTQEMGASRGGRRGRKKLTEKAKQRKRLRALPKDFDASNPPPPPDPERWVPKRERLAFKAREKQKRRRESGSAAQIKGGQGAVRKEEMENLDISKREVKEAPAAPPRLPPRGGARRGKGKR